MSRLPEYLAWLQPKMNDYNELMTKYKSLKEKECAVGNLTHSKKHKKELLLKMKHDKTITKEELGELESFEKEDAITAMWDEKMKESLTAKERKIREAEHQYEKSIEYYRREKESAIKRLETKLEFQKRRIETQRKYIEQERTITMKTMTEVAIEQDKIKVLQQMVKVISMIEYAKKSTLRESEMDDAPTVPVLPEPLVTQFTSTPAPVPTAPVTPPVVKYDYSMLGEDPATVALRQEMLSKRREKDMEEEARLREEMANRPPTRYGLIHELEKRPYVKNSYVPPVIEDEPEDKLTCDFFTKSPTSDEES